jgi:hypothetical protein
MINDILIHLSAGRSTDACVYATSIAKAFDAHLSGVVLTSKYPTWATTEGVDAKMIEQWRTEQRAEVGKGNPAF